MTRRRIVRVGLATLALLWLLAPEAAGHDLGSDLLGNIAPSSPGSAPGSLFLRHPIGAYALDYDSNVGITHLESIPPTIAQFIASLMWTATAFVVHTVIQLFTWAFSLDLVNGDRGSAGALNPVSSAISNLWSHLFGQGWLLAALAIAGLWGTYNAFVRRRYSETAGALATTAAIIFIALFFVLEPQQTIGQASRWTNQASLTLLSATTRGTVTNAQQAKGQAADQLFKTLVYDPWVVLEFGGLTHCVDPRHTVSDGYPRPTSPTAPGPKICRDHEKQGADGHGGYAERFLAFAPGSDQRKAEYAALRDGKTPDNPSTLRTNAFGGGGQPATSPQQFAGYRVDKTDSPAVDSQQLGSAYPRVVMASVVLAGALGAVVLIGFLALAVILAQVLALVLLAFAPVALVIGAIPGRGHAFFWSWLQKLATAVFVKLIYSLLIAVVLAVAAALVKATGRLGFLFAFLLETVFFWAIFVYRHKLTDRLVHATTGEQRERSGVRRFAGAAVGAAVAARGAQALRSRVSGPQPTARGQLAGGSGAAMAPVPSLRERAEHSLAEDQIPPNAEKQLRRRQQYLTLKPIKSSDEQAELERLRSGAPTRAQRGALQRRDLAHSARAAAGLPAHPPREIRGRERQLAEGLRQNPNGAARVRPSVNPRSGGTEAPTSDHPRGGSAATDALAGGVAQAERAQRTPRQAHEAIKRTVAEQRRAPPVPAPDREPPPDESPSGRRP